MQEEIKNRGAFSLSKGAERNLFDFATRRPDDQDLAFVGIYEFDGELLRVCYRIRLDPANEPSDSKRPDSFLVRGGGFRRVYVKLRRVEN